MYFKKLFLVTILCLFSSLAWSQECIEGDCLDGKGTVIYDNGNQFSKRPIRLGDYKTGNEIKSYSGSFKNNKRHGKGIMRVYADMGSTMYTMQDLDDPEMVTVIRSDLSIEMDRLCMRSDFNCSGNVDTGIGYSGKKMWVWYEAEFENDKHICDYPTRPSIPNYSESKENFLSEYNRAKNWIDDITDYLSCIDLELITKKADLNPSNINEISTGEFGFPKRTDYLKKLRDVEVLMNDQHIERYNNIFDDQENFVAQLNQQVKIYKNSSENIKVSEEKQDRWGREEKDLLALTRNAKNNEAIINWDSIPENECIEGDCENGFGTLMIGEGFSYTGYFKDRLFNGEGKLITPDAEMIGKFSDH